ncbi:hypothetical protein EUX98_g5363 [Antrodiella citrinella]|uniref:Cwf19-like C-terminal domain-containing protein n=1 Tax=Antrodiella citrinella TaxID=2447956 RepID=A0A4S4MTM8_9APHY|nr:hypothetical protein EUX98_g5363 [Antrodiella citrinella]
MATKSGPVKILTVGSANGSIRELFSKVKAIDAKHGKFDLVLCTGDFFGPPKVDEEYGEGDEVMQLLEGLLEGENIVCLCDTLDNRGRLYVAPVECYIMQGEHPLPSPVIEKFAKTGGALNKNVFLLHKSGVLTTAHGLRIACLGGMYEANMYDAAATVHGFVSPYFTNQTVENLISNTMTHSVSPSKSQGTSYTSLASIKANTSTSHLIDILLTNTLPSGIANLSNAPIPAPGFHPQTEAYPVADLVRRTKPRYHFVVGASSGLESQIPVYWEREPFIWDNENGRFTRFISLGAFGEATSSSGASSSGKKQRWFYAFSITPASASKPALPRPENATGNPLAERGVRRGLKRPMALEDEGENFRWGHVNQSAKKPRSGPQGGPPEGYKCKICESSEVCRANYGRYRYTSFIINVSISSPTAPTEPNRKKATYAKYVTSRAISFVTVPRNIKSEIQDCPVGSSQPPGRRGKPREIAPDECWFCLSNPKLAKHLIVSIGSECYVTLPKGQIIPTHMKASFTQGKIPDVPGGGHVLIVPITHYPTYSSIPPDLSGPLVEETRTYKTALWSFYAKHNAHPVSFEAVSADAIANAFTSEGTRLGVDFEFEEAERDGVTGDRGYFRVELPDGRKLVHWMKDGVPFSIQFGRCEINPESDQRPAER